jgi:hypothetical protein
MQTAAAAKGLYRSIDNGTSFVRISGGAGTGLPDQEVSDLVADPSNPNRFYAAEPVPNRAAPTGYEGVYKSEDGGLTWTVITTGWSIAVPVGQFRSARSVFSELSRSSGLAIGAIQTAQQPRHISLGHDIQSRMQREIGPSVTA